MVIISTSAVATIIHAVSAALMVEVSASAGVAAEVAPRKMDAVMAARRDDVPIIFPPALMRRDVLMHRCLVQFYSRHSGMRAKLADPESSTQYFWIPGSPALRAPRNDVTARRCRSPRCGCAGRDRSE